MSEVDTMPQDVVHEIEEFEITADEIGNPRAFVATDRGKAWLDKRLSSLYYSRYYRDRGDSLESKTCQNIAAKLIEDKALGDASDGAESVLEDILGHGAHAEDDYIEQYESEHVSHLESMRDAIAEHAEEEGLDLPELDVDEWAEVLKDLSIEHMEEEDDSSVTDLVDGHERAEIVIRLTPAGMYDMMRGGRDNEFHQLDIDQAVQHTMANLGYSIDEYRRMSGNRNKSKGLTRGLRKRRPAIATPEDILAVAAESGGYGFAFVLYAVVSLNELIKLDTTRPFMLSRFALAGYNDECGTFWERTQKHGVVIAPGEGRIEACTSHLPGDMCGLVLSYYEARLANIEEPVAEEAVDMPLLPLAA